MVRIQIYKVGKEENSHNVFGRKYHEKNNWLHSRCIYSIVICVD